MKSRRIIGAALVVVALALTPTAATADKVKDCGTTTADSSPNDNAQGTPFITTTTTTQTSACNSNSDTGQTTTSTTTNRGGHPK
jgi:hypothetical protein